MPLIKNGAFVRDDFVSVGDDEPLPANGTIVSLARLKEERKTLLGRNTALGVRLGSAESPRSLGDDVHRLSVVVLEFPKFRDGRPFSWARMLRSRLGYRSEIRASGDFLYDQIAFMMRVGFDAFEVAEGFTLEQFRRAAGEMSFVYQPAIDGRTTIRALRAAARP